MKKLLRVLIAVLLPAALLAFLSLSAAADQGIVNEIKDGGTGETGESAALISEAPEKKQTAAAAGKSTRRSKLPGGAKYVDVAVLWSEWTDPSMLTVLLGADGKLKMGEDASAVFRGEQLRRLQRWSDIVEIEGCRDVLVGLKRDGTVVWEQMCPPDREYEERTMPLDGWSGVVKLYSDDAGDALGLTGDGRVLVWENGGFYGDEGEEIMSWSDVRELVPYSYPAGSDAFAIRKDGSLAAREIFLKTYCMFRYREDENGDYVEEERSLDWMKKAAQVSTSGFLSAFLDPAGRVRAFGMYNSDELETRLGKLSGVKQIAVTQDGVACLMPNGSVRYFVGRDRESSPLSAAESWKDVAELRAGDMLLVGLHKNGKVSAASDFEDWMPEHYEALCESVRSWKNVSVIEVVLAPEGDAVLAWQKDGTLLAAGLGLPA